MAPQQSVPDCQSPLPVRRRCGGAASGSARVDPHPSVAEGPALTYVAGRDAHSGLPPSPRANSGIVPRTPTPPLVVAR